MSINYKTFGQGSFRKTSSRSGKFTGPKHSNGGIKTAGPDGNMIEVEGGESVGEVNTNMGMQPYIYSQYVKRHGGVSYADEFDKMINRGASQKEIDMLAAEQDAKAQRTDGPIQVTPMKEGGFINNNNMANKISKRVMKYDSRYRNGGVPKYQGDTSGGVQTYSGVDGDVGPAIVKQREEAAQARRERGEKPGNWFSRTINTLLYPTSWFGNTLVSIPKTPIGIHGQDDQSVDWWSNYMQQPEYEGWWSPNSYQYGGVPSFRNQFHNMHQQPVAQPAPLTPGPGAINQRQTGLQFQSGGLDSMLPFMGLAGLALHQMTKNRNKKPTMEEEVRDRDIITDPMVASSNLSGIQQGVPTSRQQSAGYPSEMMYAKRGGLGNKIMKYRNGGVDLTKQPVGPVANQSVSVDDMMNMLQFSNQQGVEGLSSQAQNQVRDEFLNMSEEEKAQWVNFMTNSPQVDAEGNPVFQEKSPTRRDLQEELLHKVLSSAPYKP